MSIKRKIAFNTIVSAGAKIINTALALVILGLITRYLGLESFGEYATVLAFLYIFATVADFGLYSITIREISRGEFPEKKILSNLFTMRLVTGLAVFGGACGIGFLFPYSSQVKLGISLGALGFWLLSNNRVLIGVFQKYLRVDRLAIGEVAGRITQLLLVAFFVWQDWGFLSIVGAVVGGALIHSVLVFLFARRLIPFSWEFDFAFWGKMAREAYPLGVAAILVMIYFKLDTVMLSLLKSSADVGIYGLAYKVLENLIFFPTVFVGLIMPLLSRYAKDAQEKFKAVVQKTLNFLIIAIVPLILTTLFLSGDIVVLLGGSQFIPSAQTLNILIFATAIIFFGSLFSNALIALKRQKSLTWIYGTGAVVNVVANLIFIPRYSYLGAAGTTVFTEALVTGLMLIVIYRSIRYLPYFGMFSKTFIAGLGMGGVLGVGYWVMDIGWWMVLGMALVVYLGILYLVGGILREDVGMLFSRR